MTLHQRRRTGFIILEVLSSLVLVTLILALFADSLTQFARLSDVLLTRQRATLAAEAVLNEIRTGHQPSDAELAARFKALTFEIQRRPGTDAWDGMTRVTVKVQGTASGGVPVRVCMEGWLRKGQP